MDGWSDGDEVHAVNWPVYTYPWDPDCDSDGLIDSIDPDPWDAMNNSLPVKRHASPRDCYSETYLLAIPGIRTLPSRWASLSASSPV
jgi:hypothetical protein